MIWTPDKQVEELRKLPQWGKFHRLCGQSTLYFDHIERVSGRSGPYRAVAFTLEDRVPVKLSEGRAKTPLEALRRAYEETGRRVAGGLELLDEMAGGGEPVDALEELFG